MSTCMLSLDDSKMRSHDRSSSESGFFHIVFWEFFILHVSEHPSSLLSHVYGWVDPVCLSLHLVFQALSHPSAVADMVYHQQYRAGYLQTPTPKQSFWPWLPTPSPLLWFPFNPTCSSPGRKCGHRDSIEGKVVKR